MKNLLLVYNPHSGSKSFKKELDNCVDCFHKKDFIVTLFRLNSIDYFNKFMRDLNDKSFFDVIVASGGDGTINIVLNAILKNDIITHLGIIPSGTANDFATYLKIPRDFSEAAKIIANDKTILADVGKANDNYFINVVAAGLLSNISHNVDKELKSMFGKFAYYLKGIETIPNLLSLPIRLTLDGQVYTEELYLFFILNSAGTGGFERLVPHAKINDGNLEFVGIRDSAMKNLAKLFIKILSGDYLDEPNIIHFSFKELDVELLTDDPIYNVSDVDGEQGPSLPLKIKNIKNAISIICENPEAFF